VPLVSYRRADTESHAAQDRGNAALEGKYVLVIDDEADARFATEALLREWGCRTASAGSLAELADALEGALRFPDAIITDYRIGERETGLDIISNVRTYTGENIPALIVTGEEITATDAAAALAVFAVIKKPVATDQLRRYLLAALEPSAATIYAV
jgi:DNA-binding NtrC family response regulator